MIVGLLKTQLNLNGIISLKQKRGIVKSLTGRLRSRFNISISEVDHNDSKRSAIIAITIVSNDSTFIDSQFEKILSFMRRDGRFYLGAIEREIF